MNDTQKMLQDIINGQSTFKQELLSKIDNVDQKVDKTVYYSLSVNSFTTTLKSFIT